MRTQPQTELPLPVQVSPKNNLEHASRSLSRREEPSFATTLDHSTKPKPVESSTKPIQESEQTNTTNKPTTDLPNAEKKSASPQLDNRVDGNKDDALPKSPLIIPEIPESDLLPPALINDSATIVPLLQNLIAEPNKNIPFTQEDTLLPTFADVDFTIPLSMTSAGNNNDAIINDLQTPAAPAQPLTSSISSLIPAVDQFNTNVSINGIVTTPLTLTKKDSVTTPVPLPAKSSIEGVVLPAVASEVAAEIDLSAVAPPIKNEALSAVASEDMAGVDLDATVPLVKSLALSSVESEGVSKIDLTLTFMGKQHIKEKEISRQTPGKFINKEDSPTAIQLPTTPASQATPATQHSDFHAIAKSLASSDAKNTSENKVEVTATQSRPLTEVPAFPQVQPTTTPAAKINSEAVNAQPLLAQNGNAMEKAVTHQIQRALVQHLPTGERMMVLRLTPPELGTVRIEVIERNGVLSARLQAEDDSVRLALERFLPGMRADLRSSDAPIREITLSDQTQFQRSFADSQQQQQSGNDNSSNRHQRENNQSFSLDGAPPEIITNTRIQTLGGKISRSSVNAFA